MVRLILLSLAAVTACKLCDYRWRPEVIEKPDSHAGRCKAVLLQLSGLYSWLQARAVLATIRLPSFLLREPYPADASLETSIQL